MIYELVNGNDPILKQKIEPFDFSNPPIDPLELSCDLAETMLHYKALGIAANQVGLKYRVFVINADPLLICFNPRIVDFSEDQVYLENGCLSYPNLWIKIKRPQVIKVRYQEPNGNVVTTKFQDMTSHVFQHELDHLNGIIMKDRASKIHIEQALSKKKKLDRQAK